MRGQFNWNRLRWFSIDRGSIIKHGRGTAAGTIKYDKERILCYTFGNSSRWKKIVPLRIGFSGSNADPYSSLHFYIWKLVVTVRPNPVRWYFKLRKKLQDYLDCRRYNCRCEWCGSYRLNNGEGFAGEPMEWCDACGHMNWSADPLHYCE